MKFIERGDTLTILVIGLNHENAPLTIREQIHFDALEKKDIERKLISNPIIKECLVLSTCNRTEIYAATDNLYLAERLLKEKLLKKVTKYHHIAESVVYVKVNDEAVTHLFTVVCGLDSLVIGETQILGQVKRAFLDSLNSGSTGELFNRLFQQAITLGKRAHTQTDIGKQAVSISYAAIQMLKRKIPQLKQKKVLLIGAGTMNKLAAQHLKEAGCNQLIFVNRTLDKAEKLAAPYNGNVYPLDEYLQLLEEVDLVICSIDKNNYLLDVTDVMNLTRRRERPLTIIDLGVPRNIDPRIGELENTYVYDVDHLHGVIESNTQQRLTEANKIKRMITKELFEFNDWKKTLAVVPLIEELQEKASNIQAEAMKHIQNKSPNLSEKEKQVILKYTKMISNQFIRQPILMMKEIALQEENYEKRDEYLKLISRIFELESELNFDFDRNHSFSHQLLQNTGS
ncbi:glutamyl-tRNA reductase [Pseudobacillus wudalianchiensis]|uniref:glutamyl-tRNA reductase n=1 Tax=Pseudobacillus wudalianchiensis TaxID=1743143 RepID=UPI000980E381|nr:glutamyl-tRNA reductase [Bacillus wudalianchiensis]